MKELRVKHLTVEPKDFPKVKAAIRHMFKGDLNLDEFDGILITTNEYTNLRGLKVKEGK